MINIDNAVKEFENYADSFDITNEHILGKKLHSIRVMNIANEIANSLNLSKEEINIATLIGLLHDIARFEQYTKYQTYNDKISFDHGDFGAEMLESGEIRKYITDSKYDNIIIKAVKNHNKFQIEEGLNAKEIFYANIARDADKIDIFYECTDMIFKSDIEQINKSKISDELVKCYEEKKLFKIGKEVPKGINEVLYVVYFVFDLNYDVCYKILKEKDYINKIFDRFDIEDEYTKNKVWQIRNGINSYINNKCKN